MFHLLDHGIMFSYIFNFYVMQIDRSYLREHSGIPIFVLLWTIISFLLTSSYLILSYACNACDNPQLQSLVCHVKLHSVFDLSKHWEQQRNVCAIFQIVLISCKQFKQIVHSVFDLSKHSEHDRHVGAIWRHLSPGNNYSKLCIHRGDKHVLNHLVTHAMPYKYSNIGLSTMMKYSKYSSPKRFVISKTISPYTYPDITV